MIIEHSAFETVRYRITGKDDIKVQVEGYVDRQKRSSDTQYSSRKSIANRSYLDSAQLYKKNDIAKSIDYVARYIESLGSNGSKDELARR